MTTTTKTPETREERLQRIRAAMGAKISSFYIPKWVLAAEEDLPMPREVYSQDGRVLGHF